jgi:acyl carrier protein
MRSLVARVVDLPVEEVSVDGNLVEELELDSLARIEIAAALEDEYGISINHADLVGLSTLPEMCRFVETQLGMADAP